MADERIVTVPEAARILGKTPDAVRGLIRRGALASTRGNDGRPRVVLPQAFATVATSDGDGRETGGRIATVAATSRDGRIEELRERLARAEAEAVELRERVATLRVEVAKAGERVEAARAVAIADVATARADVEAERKAAEARVDAARAEVAAVRELADRLTAELAEARRPWWRRWL